jgi:hypothetical protein
VNLEAIFKVNVVYKSTAPDEELCNLYRLCRKIMGTGHRALIRETGYDKLFLETYRLED